MPLRVRLARIIDHFRDLAYRLSDKLDDLSTWIEFGSMPTRNELESLEIWRAHVAAHEAAIAAVSSKRDIENAEGPQ